MIALRRGHVVTFIVRPYKIARTALGLTQRQVATVLCCSVNHIKRIERNAVPYPSSCRFLYDLLLGFVTLEDMQHFAESSR